jgi:hypothetical protein
MIDDRVGHGMLSEKAEESLPSGCDNLTMNVFGITSRCRLSVLWPGGGGEYIAQAMCLDVQASRLKAVAVVSSRFINSRAARGVVPLKGSFRSFPEVSSCETLRLFFNVCRRCDGRDGHISFPKRHGARYRPEQRAKRAAVAQRWRVYGFAGLYHYSS